MLILEYLLGLLCEFCSSLLRLDPYNSEGAGNKSGTLHHSNTILKSLIMHCAILKSQKFMKLSTPFFTW
jgi:hypothetical protein